MRLKYLPAVAFALSSFVPGSLIAQQGPPPPPEKGSVSATITEAISGYTQIKTIMLASAEKMPAENFSFKPAPEIRSYGELFTHVAQVQFALCGRLTGTPIGRMAPITATTKEEVIAVLKKSFDACDAANASVTEANALEISGGFMRGSKIGTIQKNVAHDNELYGQMVVYMRMKGIVPPSTAMRNRM
jgi:uncharacterized damage-inducible protein DinB